MSSSHDLSSLTWRVAGWTPYSWQFGKSMEIGDDLGAEVRPIPARVPGSVQAALLEAGLLPDWNVALNSRDCEWVENRHWLFEADIPRHWLERADDSRVLLNCLGLDYSGWILLDGREIGTFRGSHAPHVFDLTPYLRPGRNHRLVIAFDCPPRWLGQFGHTSQMTQWKPRFNYTWDWTARLVQIGVWDRITLEVVGPQRIGDLHVSADWDAQDGTGGLTVRAEANEATAGLHLEISLSGSEGEVWKQTMPLNGNPAETSGKHLPVAPWWPNGCGEQRLYDLRCRLCDDQGVVHDELTRRLGFRRIQWQACADAPPHADPWICEVNGRPIFLQGVNWTPIRPNFADVTHDQYIDRLRAYKQIGCNVLRVWGGGFMERDVFWDTCDELGLLVWQDFPLSSSGVENWPPEDADSIEELAVIAKSYILRRRHHASLLLWCGGNELQGALDGGKVGIGRPVDLTHPLIRRFSEVIGECDPGRRFVASSASGPRFTANPDDFGKGLHWDVHGPWKPTTPHDLPEGWREYWSRDDALFRSETGCPGASNVDIILTTAGNLPATPGNGDNPLWRRTHWWIEWPKFVDLHHRQPADLAEYVAWSQARQAEALTIAASACKQRFPKCGGILIWMGHDSFPCTANTSILDFHGRPKPAALALAEVFRGHAEQMQHQPARPHFVGKPT